MRSHIKHIKPNLIRLARLKRAEGEKDLGLSKETYRALRGYIRPESDCGSMLLTTLDDIARGWGVNFGLFLYPPGAQFSRSIVACSFAKNLCYYTEESAKTVKQIRQDSGVANGTFHNYKNFESVPSMEKVQHLADALEIPVAQLFELNVDLWKESYVE